MYVWLFMPPKWWKLNYTDGISEKTSNFSLNASILIFFSGCESSPALCFTLFTTKQSFFFVAENIPFSLFPDGNASLFTPRECNSLFWCCPLHFRQKIESHFHQPVEIFSPRLSLLVCKLDKKGLQFAQENKLPVPFNRNESVWATWSCCFHSLVLLENVKALCTAHC